ncbi:TPA: class I SAM-dependent methyltransferase [Pseudomonas aeruginosa]
MNPESYVLAVGTADVRRLAISDRIYGAASRRLLTPWVARRNIKILDAGCGPGNMLLWFSAEVGEGGSVVGADRSRQQLSVARQRAQAEGRRNIRFAEADVEDLHEFGEAFDLVYCRFTLIHLENPLRALRSLYAVLKPGGMLVCEEPVTESHACTPYNEAFDRANRLTIALGRSRGVDYDLGYRLGSLCVAAGFERVTVNSEQPEIAEVNERSIFSDSFSQVMDQVVAAGLAQTHEVDGVLQGLRALEQDPAYRLKGFCTVQVQGFRSH